MPSKFRYFSTVHFSAFQSLLTLLHFNNDTIYRKNWVVLRTEWMYFVPESLECILK